MSNSSGNALDCRALNKPIWAASFITRSMRYNMAFVVPSIGLINFVIVVLGTYKRVASSTSHFYIMALGVADFYATISIETQYLMNDNMYPFNEIECVLKQFHKIAPSQIAIWFLVSMTVDRAVAVWKPLQAASFCTIKRARKLLMATALILTVQNLGWCSQFEPFVHRIWTNCQMIDKDRLLLVYYSVINVVSLYVPFLVMSFANVVIVTSVRQSAKVNVAHQNASTSKKHGASAKITTLVVTTALAFMIFTFPLCLFDTLILEKGTIEATTVHYLYTCDHVNYAWFLLLGQFTGELMFKLNHVLNGFIYLASSGQFRKDIRAALCLNGDNQKT